MVEFGKKLLSSQVEHWKEYYIDYGGLKALIGDAIDEKKRQQKQREKRSADIDLSPSIFDGNMSVSRSNTNLVVKDAVSEGLVAVWAFRRMLDHEIQKIVLFILTREGQLAERLYQLSKDGQSLKTKILSLVRDFSSQEFFRHQKIHSKPTLAVTEKVKTDAWNHLKTSTDRHRAFAKDLLQLINYIDMNLTGLRKILKKHDKHFTHQKLSGIYLQQQARSINDIRGDDLDLDGVDDYEMTDSHLEKLFHFGGLSALILTLRRAFDDLHLLELHLLTMSDAAKSASQHRSHRRKVSTPHGVLSYGSVDDLNSLNEGRIGGGITPKLADHKSPSALGPPASLEEQNDPIYVFNPPRPNHLLSTTITCEREPILDKIYAGRSRLRQTTKYAELVAAQALIFVDEREGQIPDKDKTPASEFTSSQRISSMLNLISTFLYMENYYIVAPSVGEYALRLGSDESMAGIIIGMTPNAALIATVLYGFWSSYSYRNALIFASSSSFLGNILYALALKYNSIHMVLLGRFFVGFGSARSINRRYIADVFSKADRTAASADFVSYAALGMAAGPFSAFLVGHLTFDPSNVIWTDVTAPGWIMLVLWGVFLVFLVTFFEEPDRTNMYEEKTKPLVSKADAIENSMSIDKEENKPLLIGRGDDENDSVRSAAAVKKESTELPLWKNVAVMVSLWLYFVLKLVLEMLMSSSGLVSKYYFNWGQSKCGLFLAVIALLMFPVNMVVAKLSQKYEDRELIAATLIVMLVSVLGIIDYLPVYSVSQYILFGVGVFISANSLEGVNMSMLSKVIPTSWAKGTFNSGFLATEAGTLARSVGDVIISTVTAIFGTENLLDGLFTPMAVLCAISVAMVYLSYGHLTDSDDDDESDSYSNTSNEAGRESHK